MYSPRFSNIWDFKAGANLVVNRPLYHKFITCAPLYVCYNNEELVLLTFSDNSALNLKEVDYDNT